MNNEHGYCPNCGINFDGDLIWDTGMEMYGNAEKADEYAKAYGATRTTGRWGKKIGIYSMEEDRTTGWKCVECKHEWQE
jgi:hypothetical protein